MPLNDTPQKAAINSKIEDLVKDKYLGMEKTLQRGRAFVDLSTSILCDSDVREEDVTDGNDDNGIDCVYIVSNEGKSVNVFTCKSSLKDDFSERDLKEFKNGLELLFVVDKSNYAKIKNKNLVAKIEDIRDEKGDIFEVNCYYCVYNGKNKEEEKVVREKEKIEKYFIKYFSSIYPAATFSLQLISAEDLFLMETKRIQTLRGQTVKLRYYGDRVIGSEIEIDGAKGRLATVKGEDIARLVNEYGEALFEKNVRGWMTFRKYNADILRSCSSKEDAELFWFLNNGITVICDSCIPDPDKRILKFVNPQIINGQQTSIVLQKASQSKRLCKAVKILLKIYETKDDDLILKVAKSTNSQLAVKSRDLASNNPEQIALQEGFKRRGYFYERQRGESKPKRASVKCSFNNFFVAQSILAVILQKPSLARKKQENILFGEPLYSQIFNRSTEEIVASTLLCNFCVKEGKRSLKKSLKDEIVYFAPLHLARIIWEKLNIADKSSCDALVTLLENEDLDEIMKQYRSSLNLLSVILKEYSKKEGEIVSVGHFFARLEIDREITKKISRQIKKK